MISLSRLSFFDVRQNFRDDFRLRLRALRAAVVDTDAQIAFTLLLPPILFCHACE